MKMDSSEILQLLAHNIRNPKVMNIMEEYQLTEFWPEFDKYDYCNKSNTMCLSFVSVSFRPGFNGNLPFALAFNMDDAAISQTLQIEPTETSIRPQPPQNLKKGISYISCIDWHIRPYILYVLHSDGNPYCFQFSLIDKRYIEAYNLYQDYPDYVRKKCWYHYFKFWRSK